MRIRVTVGLQTGGSNAQRATTRILQVYAYLDVGIEVYFMPIDPSAHLCSLASCLVPMSNDENDKRPKAGQARYH